MTLEGSLQTVRAELEVGIMLPKCQKCGCMESALRGLDAVLSGGEADGSAALAQIVRESLKKMRPVRYTCLGCEHCFPAVAQNAFLHAFPSLDRSLDLSCEFRLRDEGWPPVVGEYCVLDSGAPIAVSTLASVQLVEALTHRQPKGLAIVGKTETENIGVDKIVKNVITNPAIRYLIVAGTEPRGHLSGHTLLLLAGNGVDENGRVIGSSGKRPILRNASPWEIQAFREQVQIIDMIGCESPDEIVAHIEGLSQQVTALCGCSECGGESSVSISNAPKILARGSDKVVKMDGAGYFVIVPVIDRGVINVEHYAYDNTLLRVIEGASAQVIYSTLVSNSWVTELSHAAYLGKELAKAELSLKFGFKYVQDGA